MLNVVGAGALAGGVFKSQAVSFPLAAALRVTDPGSAFSAPSRLPPLPPPHPRAGTSRRGLRRGRHERGDDRAHVGHECRANLSRAQGGRQRVRGGSTTRCERRVRRPRGDMRGRRPARGGGGSGAAVGGLRRCRSYGAAVRRDCALVCRSIGALAAWVVGGGGSRQEGRNFAAGRERTSCDLQMKLPWVHSVCSVIGHLPIFCLVPLRVNLDKMHAAVALKRVQHRLRRGVAEGRVFDRSEALGVWAPPISARPPERAQIAPSPRVFAREDGR